jgi:hypothetical protein
MLPAQMVPFDRNETVLDGISAAIRRSNTKYTGALVQNLDPCPQQVNPVAGPSFAVLVKFAKPVRAGGMAPASCRLKTSEHSSAEPGGPWFTPPEAPNPDRPNKKERVRTGPLSLSRYPEETTVMRRLNDERISVPAHLRKG